MIINKYGAAQEVFENIELPTPVPAADEILVKVMSTSINPIDYKIRGGYLPHLIPSFPAILQGDFAGIVSQIGTDVSGFEIGDHVYACNGAVLGIAGALAEYTTGDYRLFAKMPENLSFQQAAAVPLAGITAYEAVFYRMNITKGQKVLIYGSVGGVGHFALQFVKSLGGIVYATVSDEEQAKTAKTLGADYTINYKKEPIQKFVDKHTNGKGFDVVFDAIGNQNLLNSFEAVKIKGLVVTTQSLEAIDLSMIHEKALEFHTVYMIIPILYDDKKGKKEHGEILKHIGKLITDGAVTPLIARNFSFEEVADAHNYAEKGNLSGKVIISRSDDNF